MKSFKALLLTLSICSVYTLAVGQDVPVPSTFVLRDAADYKEYEKELIETIDWLETTPINTMKEERKLANTFFMQWIQGAPNVTIELNGEILTFTGKNSDLLVSFMAGWTKLALTKPELKEDAVKCNLAGLESVIRVYKANKGNGMKKDKAVENLIELQDKGELEKWVEEMLAKK